MSIFHTPGLHTDVQESKNLDKMKSAGFEWIAYQVQNGSVLKNRDLNPAKTAKLNAGVWGVSYEPGHFRRDSVLLADRAKELQAQHVIMNIERSIDNPEDVIDPLADFNGPKALITIIGELPNIHAKTFLDAGWDFIAEAYYNDARTLTPGNAAFYAMRAGIPLERISVALGMYGTALGSVTGEQYVQLLAEGGFHTNFSCWMLEHGTDEDYLKLGAYAKLTPVEVLLQKLATSNLGFNAWLEREQKLYDAVSKGDLTLVQQALAAPNGVAASLKTLLSMHAKINELVEAHNAN